jgi:hypothetical protein
MAAEALRAVGGFGVGATPIVRRRRWARLGHSDAMLLRGYANCFDGQEGLADESILAALADGEV